MTSSANEGLCEILPAAGADIFSNVFICTENAMSLHHYHYVCSGASCLARQTHCLYVCWWLADCLAGWWTWASSFYVFQFYCVLFIQVNESAKLARSIKLGAIRNNQIEGVESRALTQMPHTTVRRSGTRKRWMLSGKPEFYWANMLHSTLRTIPNFTTQWLQMWIALIRRKYAHRC